MRMGFMRRGMLRAFIGNKMGNGNARRHGRRADASHRDVFAAEGLEGRVLLSGITDLALMRTAADTPHSGTAANAFDGNRYTHWSASASSAPSIRVDLGAAYGISGVRIHWHTDPAAAYSIETSPDGTSWTTAKSVTGNDAADGWDQISLLGARNGDGAAGRFVRLSLTSPVAGRSSYSIRDIEIDGGPNLALGRTTVASSIHPNAGGESFVASHATDGNASTRWASNYVSTAAIKVDLGAVYDIDRVRLSWESRATHFKVQVSDLADGPWTDAYATSSNSQNKNDLAVSGRGRYVRIECTAGVSGLYSLWDWEVFGPPDLARGRPAAALTVYDSTMPASNVTDGDPATRWTSAHHGSNPRSWIYVDLQSSHHIDRVRLKWQSPASQFRVQVGDYAFDQLTDQSNWREALSAAVTDNGMSHDLDVFGVGRYVRILCENATNIDLYSLFDVQVFGSPNLALGHAATASSEHGPAGSFVAGYAADNNVSTRWASASGQAQNWLWADLGADRDLSVARVWWQGAPATAYRLQTLPHGADPTAANASWTQVYATTTNTSLDKPVELNAGARGRYVRVVGDSLASGSVYSIHAFEVFAPAVEPARAPAAPATFTAAAFGAGVDLSWQDVNGEWGYRIDRSADAGATWSQLTTRAENVTSYRDEAVLAGHTYHYRLTAHNAGGDSPPLTGHATLRHPAPTGLSFSDVTASSVTLTWQPSAGATGYVVERSPAGQNLWTLRGQPTTVTLTDSTDGGTAYDYRVSATGAGGISDAAAVNVTTPPVAPSNATANASPSDPTGIDVHWTASTTMGAIYNVYASTTPGFSPDAASRVSSGVSGTSVTVGNRDPSLAYYFLVTAVSGGAESAPAAANGGSPTTIGTGQAAGSGELPTDDDGYSQRVNIGFGINFYGRSFTSLFVNNNGNVTFDAGDATFTPSIAFANRTTPMIAPFWADVDTRVPPGGTAGSTGTVRYGATTVDARRAFRVDWANVGYYSYGYGKRNTFSVALVDRSDVSAGDFDVVFEYAQVQWETGNVSGGSGGIGGTAARAGFANGSGLAGTFFELPGSAVSMGLIGKVGVETFEVRNASEVKSVVPLTTQESGGATTGDLSHDNPNGQEGTPNFGGGWRYFPDAKDFDTRDVSRNIVRIRAEVAPAAAGTDVHFRSFDVDDPSPDTDIDPNGNGRDNRGRLQVGDLQTPAPPLPPGELGYQGRLRPVGGQFAFDGDVVTVKSFLEGEKAYAEVELATSFQPGDNFRVAASLNKPELENLDARTAVPTAGAINGFGGAATEQLAIWRRVHVETDVIIKSPGDKLEGQITARVELANDVFELTTDMAIDTEDEYVGGMLRAGNRNYHITGNTGGTPAAVTVRLLPGQLAPPEDGVVEIFQDDYTTGVGTTGNAVSGRLTAMGDPKADGTIEVSTNLTLSQADEFAGAVLRAAGINHEVVSNTAGASAKVVVRPSPDGNLALGNFTLYKRLAVDAPQTFVDTSDDAKLYDLMLASTLRTKNRFADAYIVPEYTTLDRFDSRDVPAATHLDTTTLVDNRTELDRHLAPFHGAAGQETPVFWAVYVATAFEADRGRDRDPATEPARMGITKLGRSAVFYETERDALGASVPLHIEWARTAVHEVGHQLLLTTEQHRDEPENIMMTDPSGLADDKFFFHPKDVAIMREISQA